MMHATWKHLGHRVSAAQKSGDPFYRYSSVSLPHCQPEETARSTQTFVSEKPEAKRISSFLNSWVKKISSAAGDTASTGKSLLCLHSRTSTRRTIVISNPDLSIIRRTCHITITIKASKFSKLEPSEINVRSPVCIFFM